MSNIAFLELATHQNNLYALLKIATTGSDDITAFTTESIAESVQTELDAEASNITWVKKGNEESLWSYLQQVEKYCEHIDLLLVQPLYGGLRKLFIYSKFNPPCMRALTIFNARRWLGASYSLRHWPVHNLNTALQRRIVSGFHALIVEYPPIANYLNSNIGVDLPVHTLSPTLFEGDQYIPDGAIRFTVPGYIESERRAYDLILDVFADLFEQFDDEIELQFLGTPRGEYGERILNRCDEFKDAGYNTVTYRDWIPLERFESGLRRSHFLLSPLQQTIRKGPVKERYGTTKGSGNLWDAVRKATPLILPSYFTVDNMFADATVTYQDSDDLRGSLKMLVHNRERRQALYDRALEMSRAFTRDRQYERLSQLVTDISSVEAEL